MKSKFEDAKMEIIELDNVTDIIVTSGETITSGSDNDDSNWSGMY